MKLNMIVVMTMWLPRVACSHAGMSAHAAPNSAAPRMATGNTTNHGATSPSHNAAMATPSPPI